MSSHQNSVFNGESALNLIPSPLSRNNYAARATHPIPKPSARTQAPEAIWGQYNNYRANGVVVSSIIHIAVIGLLISGALFAPQVVQKVTERQHVTLIAPSPDTYALPTAKIEVSG